MKLLFLFFSEPLAVFVLTADKAAFLLSPKCSLRDKNGNLTKRATNAFLKLVSQAERNCVYFPLHPQISCKRYISLPKLKTVLGTRCDHAPDDDSSVLQHRKCLDKNCCYLVLSREFKFTRCGRTKITRFPSQQIFLGEFQASAVRAFGTHGNGTPTAIIIIVSTCKVILVKVMI